MNFKFQLRDILLKNFTHILNFSEYKSRNPCSDFNVDFLQPVVIKNNSVLISLTVFTDGVNIKKSTFKKELWPIWLQIADLPPKLRMAQKNVVLAALYIGSKVPDWTEVVPELRAELLTSSTLNIGSNLTFEVTFKVKLMVCDLGAKSHVLNMLKFNGFFGCHYCTVEGLTIGRTHSYYPFEDVGQIREPAVNDPFIFFADNLTSETKNVVGVKGRSAFARLVDGLPLTAPIDYMHCVLLGVFPETLKVCVKALNNDKKLQIDQVVSALRCPREMIAYSRKIRPLGEMGPFKANENFNWLFYVSPIVFLSVLPRKLLSHLYNLVYGVRLLLESSSEEKVNKAEYLLTEFCRQIVEMHQGDERIETINVHCIRHFADQVRRFGPLSCYSAMSFEAANRTLGEVFTGANSECEVICRRLLQKHKLAHADLSNRNLKKLFNSLSGLQNSDSQFSDQMLETEDLRIARSHYRDASFFNRLTICDRYFDSISYKRSKRGNCYVYWIDETENF